MTLYFVLAVLAVLVSCAAATWVIWEWGLGQKTWEVWCPVFKKEAKVLAIQMEVESVPPCAGLQVFEIKRCSLFKGQPVNCRKECLQRP
jgi:hypothetical protein